MRAQVVGAMRQHHALRFAGRAAREEQHVQVGLAQRGLAEVVVDRGRRGLGQRDAGARTGVQADERYPDLVGDDLAGLGVRVVDDQHRGPGEAHHLDRLVDTEQGVGRCEDRAQLGRRGEQRNRVERGVAPHHDAVLMADAQIAQHVRDSIRLLSEFAIREAPLAHRRRDAVRAPIAPRCGRYLRSTDPCVATPACDANCRRGGGTHANAATTVRSSAAAARGTCPR